MAASRRFPGRARAPKPRCSHSLSGQLPLGAIVSVGSDYEDNGRDAGLLAAEVIRGKDPATTPFQRVEEGPPRRSTSTTPAATRSPSRSLAREGRRRSPRRAAMDGSLPERNEGMFMDCQISRSDDVALVVIVGSLDSSWSSYLSEQFDEVVRGGAHEVQVDMSGVTYLSSNGIGLLIRYHRQMRRSAGDSGSWPIPTKSATCSSSRACATCSKRNAQPPMPGQPRAATACRSTVAG